ncbi:tyrosine-type recombinase/integrase [Glycomyces artemisiae]|uniref:Site-specific recombinase XerD n=1 Tax=Glycomyces artemisiae TaxID=1076443 RepID=A0A2T0UAE4_9ACTN|nr:site-specific integrase [Glycomyces artemisiae]PRY54896.1 site-specific recombinase XerD [Glycomyces artemisiae]
MRAYVEDRWWKAVYEDGKRKRVKTERYGKGERYRARWTDMSGKWCSKSYDKKGDADAKIDEVKAELKAGTYIDPDAGKTDTAAFAKEWLKGLGGDIATKEKVRQILGKHFIPQFEGRPLEAVLTSTIRTWLGELPLEESTKAVLFVYVNSMFEAAVDDRLIRTNPCQARSLQKPRAPQRQVTPWNRDQVDSVHDNLLPRYRAMVLVGAGCGHRIGEVFGLAVDDILWDDEEIEIRRQVKFAGGKRLFAPPKHNSVRKGPLPRFTAQALREHMEQFPPVDVTLPWMEPGGELVTVKLVFTTTKGFPIHRSTFMTNPGGWKRGTSKTAFEPEQATGFHALRYFFAATYLENGGNPRGLADYLGHKDPGFTLRVYGHLMPNSRQRARKLLDDAWEAPRPKRAPESDG